MARSTTTRQDSGGATIGIGEAGVLLVSGEGLLRTFPFDRPELVIGRDRDCDVVLDHPALSRRHARLRRGPPLTVQDLGSTNGTRLARQSCSSEPAPLAVGESFHIGKLSFVVLRSAHPGTTADAAAALQLLDPTVAGASPLVGDIARSAIQVLILGETGVGKEVLAETLHRLSGRSGPFQRLNCAALSPTLLESELFGHERGAFTGAAQAKPGLLEAAAGGTVFLDEVGELPEAVQVKLLRALETREVLRVGAVRPRALDVRFLSATNRDLPAEVASGRFRADLYYRLDGITLSLVPLRERPHQIARLALEFLTEAQARQHPGKSLAVAPELLARIEAHPWPGNVRELKATMERAVLLARGGEVGAAHLALAPAVQPAAAGRAVPAAPPAATPAEAAEAEERQRILDALEACGGNQTRAAQKLGISRTTLVGRLNVLRIPRPRK